MPHPAPGADSPTSDQPTEPPHVELLHWPGQEDRRLLLASLGEPRVLLLATGTPVPTPLDDLELWLPEDADPTAIVNGVTTLQRKVLATDTRPALDDDGLLWFRGRWVAVSDSQIAVVDLLVQNYRRLVHNEDLSRIYQGAGGSDSPASLRTLIRRITQRLAQVGLRLHVVRRRGVILETDQPPPARREGTGSRR